MKTFDYTNIPETMKQMPHWILWARYPDPTKENPEHIGKTPINAYTLNGAMSNNPKTWTGFNEALTALNRHNGATVKVKKKEMFIDAEICGIGFMLQGSGIVCIDLDNKASDLDEYINGGEGGVVGNFLKATQGRAYAEISQSGEGVHIFARGSLPDGRKKNSSIGVEMYATVRFIAMTGLVISTHTNILDDCTEVLKELHEKYLPDKKPIPRAAAHSSVTPPNTKTADNTAPAPVFDTDINTAIETARKTNRKFSGLYNGDQSGYPSFSEARGALLCILAYYLYGDPEKIEQAYRASGLFPQDKKFDDKRGDTTLGKIEISTAIDKNGGNFFNYNKKHSHSESAAAAFSQPLEWDSVINDETATDPKARADQSEVEPPDAAETMKETPKRVLSWFFYENSRGDIRVDPAKLSIHIHDQESYFWVANDAMDGVRRYFYNEQRGVYEWLSDERIKGKIKDYISKEAPTLIKSRDINEAFNLLVLENCRYPDSAIDNAENLINFQNGYYDIFSGKMSTHSSGILSTIQLPLKFDPSRNYILDDAPIFKQYLETLTEGDKEKQTLLLEYMGAALSNVPGYKFKSALFLVGESNTGKSKYIELIYRLLGDGNFASISFADLEERFQSGAIYGKRLVCDADMKVQRAKGNGLFMKITGGDPVQIEYKNMNPFTTIHRGFLLFASNAMPRWGGNTTEAAYNRMMIIECNNIIPTEKQDPDLHNKLFSERKVIVSLAIRALKNAILRGYKFTRPASMDKSVKQLRRNNSPTIEFFESCCKEYDDADRNINHCMARPTMHRVFRDWCKINVPSAYIPTAKEFYRDILQYKKMTEGNLIKLHHGYEYYKFTLTLDAKRDFNIYDNVNIDTT